MKTRHYQKGMTGTGWLIVLGLIGLAAIVFIRLLPLYYENFQIKSILESMKSDQAFTPTSKPVVWKKMYKLLDVNGIKSLRKEHLTLVKSKDKITLSIKYESRSAFLGNLDIIGKFEQSMDFPVQK
ncbi:MAG: DUF4845 domain-containing protein [Gammaproteobacteria bacterium]|nr:DUF4845 domain-containing protein [Gammaproteobacteria bacterium]